MNQNDVHTPAVSRRGLMAGAGAGVALLAVTACADDGTGSSSSGGYGGATEDGGGGGGGAATESGAALADVSDVPVGGAVSAEDAEGAPVIVSRPSQSEVVAFSAVCTHKGCTVAPKADRLECPCHGSTFDLATGENTGGPAPRPLPRIRVKVQDGKVMES